MAEPVEGPSEVDIAFEHRDFLIFTEAKLTSDISAGTTYDPQRNQIVRNIDCLISSAGNRDSMFWLLVKDDAYTRAYVQLVNAYKSDPGVLIRELPHRNPATLRFVAGRASRFCCGATSGIW
jgi:hypothetical protein